MKVVVLYRPNSEHARKVEEFCRDFVKRDSSRRIEMVNIDSVEGSNMAKAYGVIQYPAFISTTDDGSFLKLWEGDQDVPPLMSELAYYANS